LKKNYPETKTGQGDKETGREGDEETLRTAKDMGGKDKRPVFVARDRASWGELHVLIILKTSKGGPY
jgi:hypothetical protein